jgi:N-acetylglutamate synthase-like GNAT family acetyltransferase
MSSSVTGPPTPSLRRATAADAGAIAGCVNEAYAPWVPRIGRKPWPMLQDYAVVVQKEQVTVAEADGQIIGVLVLSVTPSGLLIDNVAVARAWQGKGIGRTLLQHAEHEARRLGQETIYLYTNELMAENIALYARVGYVEYERRQEEGFRRVFMRKSLSKGYGKTR